MAYSDKVIDHYENPRNVGSLDGDASVGMVMLPAGNTVPQAAAAFPWDWQADMVGLSEGEVKRSGRRLQCAGLDAQAVYSASAGPAPGVAPWRER